MKSCLWEMEVLMKSHYDERVRNYSKVFKTELNRKEAYFKCEDFTTVDPLEVLEQDLNDIDNEKEGLALKKHLLKKHGQDAPSRLGLKRTSDQLDYQNSEILQGGQPNQRFKYAEDFEEMDDIFALKD